MKKIRNFDIQHKLGSGSYGVIYKVLNKVTKQICVLKQISLGRLSQKARKSAINEATIMGKLVHPFIVRYRQSFIQDKTLNIVMEYCDNGDLNNFLKLQNKRPLKQDKIWRFFIQITIGLEYIHKNKILHRDIKSLNIFMNKNEEIKIGDLGVAKMLTSNEFAQTMVGTPFYLSPQLCEQKPYNQKSDIWALGCLLYELCTFRHPFEAQNQASLILKIVRGKYNPIPEFYSKDLKEVIDLCLERDYKRRPTTSNLLSRPKIKAKIQEFGIEKMVDEELRKITKEKENIASTPSVKQNKPVIPAKPSVVKAIEVDSKKVVKALDSEPKIENIKKEIVKKEEILKKEQVIKKPEVKREPVVILPKPINHGQKKAEPSRQHGGVKENKNEFIANLEKMMDHDEKQKKVIKQSNIFAEPPIKRQQKIQKIAEKVQQLKGAQQKNIPLVKSPSLNEQKRQTPAIPNKKSSNSNEAHQVKKSQIIKPPLPSKPPVAPSSQANKEPITKVKNEKVIQPKVYDSHKNLYKPSGIIKSGGFSTHVEGEKSEKEKHLSESRDKVLSSKRVSNPMIKIQKEKEPPKQLFGPSQTPTPSVKSQKMIKAAGYAAIYEQKKKQQNNKVSRVRKGVKNQIARNARNVSRFNEVSKEEEDMVMNLPSKLSRNDNGIESSSDSDEDPVRQKERNLVQDLKRKSNHNKFQLKEINDDLVLQKYEDMLKSAQGSLQKDQKQPEPKKDEDSLQELDIQKAIQNYQPEEQQVGKMVENDEINEDQDNIVEELSEARKNSRNSNQPIQQIFDNDILDEKTQRQDELYDEYDYQNELEGQNKNQEWSFDEEPELPYMQQKQSPYFEQHNPYLIQEQEESTENKINHLQAKLQQNIKRQDQINKLMQIKLDQCRKFVGTQKSLQQILQFFRKKLHMDDDYNESDEKEVQIFLRKKGLTDHNKFQNIYKIMHFEMELENTRKIIQRICKKLSELEEDS